jgi:ankyrin repeat protein
MENPDIGEQLLKAVQDNDLGIVETLFATKPFPNREHPDNKWGGSIARALHMASKKGSKDILKFLVEKGADPDTRNIWKETPLHQASKAGHIDIIRFLLGAGANANSQSKGDETPLHWASHKGFREIVSYLLHHGAKPDSQDDCCNTPLHNAARKGHLEIVQDLVQHAEDKKKYVDMINTIKGTALQEAVITGSLDVVKYLVVQGTSLDLTDSYGCNAAHNACIGKQSAIMRQLLEGGDKVDIINQTTGSKHFGRTCLHLAAMNDNGGDIEWLLDQQADPTIKDAMNNTAWELACTEDPDRPGSKATPDAMSAFGLKDLTVNCDTLPLSWVKFTGNGCSEFSFNLNNVQPPLQTSVDQEMLTRNSKQDYS